MDFFHDSKFSYVKLKWLYQKQIISNFTFIFDCYKNLFFFKSRFSYFVSLQHGVIAELSHWLTRGDCLLYVVCGMRSAHVAPGWTVVDSLHGLFKMPVEIFCLKACFMNVRWLWLAVALASPQQGRVDAGSPQPMACSQISPLVPKSVQLRNKTPVQCKIHRNIQQKSFCILWKNIFSKQCNFCVSRVDWVKYFALFVPRTFRKGPVMTIYLL